MKFRLFWKILLVSWLITGLASMAVFRIVFSVRHISDKHVREERLRSADVAYLYGGQTALDQVTAAWPPEVRAHLLSTRNPEGDVHFDLPLPIYFSALRFEVEGIQLGALLLLSAALGGYLSRPIAQMRAGFQKISQGDLTTRLGRSVGGWDDEIADLANEFDAMATRLQNLVASRDRLLHDVSHELRSPLARLSLAVGLARRNRELSELTLSRVEAECERLNVIVGDLLSLARVESEVAVEEIYFDISALLKVICDDAHFEARPRGVSVELNSGPRLLEMMEPPLMKGAPELLRRAFENVIRNALRFSPLGKAVRVRAEIAQDMFVVEVRDEGPGMRPEMLDSIFDPFVRGSDKGHGIGLGLAIARRAVVAHKGTLQAFNIEGGGFLMRFTVPTHVVDGQTIGRSQGENGFEHENGMEECDRKIQA